MPSYHDTFFKRTEKSVVKLLQRNFSGLKDASKTWFEFIRDESEAAGMSEIQSALCVFRADSIIAVRYVDVLVAFCETRGKLNLLKEKLIALPTAMDFGLASFLLEMEINLKE